MALLRYQQRILYLDSKCYRKKKCREGRNNNIYKNAFWANVKRKIDKHCADNLQALCRAWCSRLFINFYQPSSVYGNFISANLPCVKRGGKWENSYLANQRHCLAESNIEVEIHFTAPTVDQNVLLSLCK